MTWWKIDPGDPGEPREGAHREPPVVWLPIQPSPGDGRKGRETLNFTGLPYAPHGYNSRTGIVREFNRPRFFDRRSRKIYQRARNQMAASP